MSAQINLYHPRFLRQHDMLTLANVALAAAVLYVLLAVVGGWAWYSASTRKAAAAEAEAQFNSIREQVEAATAAAATRKPDPQLLAALEQSEGSLRRRTEVAQLLESGIVGTTGGFAEYLRGLARQAPEGLWLTGFSIGSGGAEMEIRGSMLNPEALPDYIRRLGTEQAFQGRSFAALTMNRADPVLRAVAAAGSGAPPAASAPVPVSLTTASAPRPIDFVLLPKPGEAKAVKQ